MKRRPSYGFVLTAGIKAHVTAAGLRRPRCTAGIPEVLARALVFVLP